MSKRTIPEIRARLLEIAAELRDPYDILSKLAGLANELEQLAEETIRRSPSRKRAPVKMKAVYQVDKQAVINCARNNPKLHLSEIATMFATNPGRISEILKEGL